MAWKTVSKAEFFATIGPLNCRPTIVSDYPYTSEFRTPRGDVVGKIVDDGSGDSEYQLPRRENEPCQ